MAIHWVPWQSEWIGRCISNYVSLQLSTQPNIQGKTIILEGETKSFHGKNRLKEFMVTMKALQRIEGMLNSKKLNIPKELQKKYQDNH